MIVALVASLAIVVQDRTMLRAAPSATGTVLTALSEGDTLEVRDERVGYLKVYDYRRERGGYLRADTVRVLDVSEAGAPELLAVLRFLRDSPGFEALGISYGAAYIKAAPPRSLTAEPFEAIARMAERLADTASSANAHAAEAAAHIEVVQQYGIRTRTFERDGRMRVCYDGELYRRVLSMPHASPEQRASSVLALTRADCMDPDLSASARFELDHERSRLLEALEVVDLSAMMRSRINARRAAVLASLAFEQARRGEESGVVAARALAALVSAHAEDLGEDRRAEFLEAVLRVGAIPRRSNARTARGGSLILSATPGEPGQTCISIGTPREPGRILIRRCTYGIVWLGSEQEISQAPALVVAVEPLDGWRELWVFHRHAAVWTVDVLSPGTETPQLGYVEFAGFAEGTQRLLIAREVFEHGRFMRRFEERRLDDMVMVRQSSTPDLLRDFGRWEDPVWRRETLTLR